MGKDVRHVCRGIEDLAFTIRCLREPARAEKGDEGMASKI